MTVPTTAASTAVPATADNHFTELTDDELQDLYWARLDDEYTDLFIEALGADDPGAHNPDASNPDCITSIDPRERTTIEMSCMDELIRKEYTNYG